VGLLISIHKNRVYIVFLSLEVDHLKSLVVVGRCKIKINGILNYQWFNVFCLTFSLFLPFLFS